MPSVYNSAANLPIGSRVITLNATSFVVEGEWAPDKKTREIRRNDVNGDSSDFQLRTEPTVFSATLQRANTDVAPPVMGNIANVDNINYVVTSIKPREVQGGFHMYDVGFRSVALPSG